MTYAYAGKRDAYIKDRNQRLRQEEMLDSYGLSMQYDAVQTPEDILLERERAAILHNAMLELPARVERVVRLRWFNGEPYRETGDGIGVSGTRAHQIEWRAIRQLTSKLKQKFPVEIKRIISHRERLEREKEAAKHAQQQLEYEEREAEQAERDAAFEVEQAEHRARQAEIWRKTVEERDVMRAAFSRMMLAAHEERERKAKRKEEQARAHREQVAQEIARQEHNEAISLAYNTMLDDAVKRFERSRLAYMASLGGTHEEACYKEYVNAIYLHQLARRAWDAFAASEDIPDLRTSPRAP
jgi:Sigma-70, region 4